MLITRYTHSCIRLESRGRVIVIDPGKWSEPEALTGADIVLLTHEHGDHVEPGFLTGFDGDLYAPAGANLPKLDPTELSIGARIELGGMTIEPVGGRHAEVIKGQDVCVNAGYIVDGAVYHPGDALHVPDRQIDTLFVPIQASWLKTSEAIDFVNRVAPRQAFGMHEGQVNERGISAINRWLSQECHGVYRWLPPGETVALNGV